MTYKRFYFNANDGISYYKVKEVCRKFGAENVLIGIDPGDTITPSPEPYETIKAIKETKCGMHVYFVGVGMMSWSSQERQQIRDMAKRVHIDVTNKDWHDEWLDWGWRDYVVEALDRWAQYGPLFHSFEIDNLDSALGDDPDAYIQYFKELSAEMTNRNIQARLMLKNFNSEMLEALSEAIRNQQLSKDFFCEFGMFEKGSGDPKDQLLLCANMGIQAITPENGLCDTNHYGVIDKGVEYTI